MRYKNLPSIADDDNLIFIDGRNRHHSSKSNPLCYFSRVRHLDTKHHFTLEILDHNGKLIGWFDVKNGTILVLNEEHL